MFPRKALNTLKLSSPPFSPALASGSSAPMISANVVDVRQADWRWTARSGIGRVAVANAALGPRDDERHAMPAFVRRSLVRAEWTSRDIAVFLGAVVRCEDHESCLDKLRVRLSRIGGLLQPIEHATEGNVVLKYVVVSRVHRLARLRAGRTGNRHAADCLVGCVGAVVGIGRVVEEEWPGLGRCFADVAGQELHCVVRMTAAESVQ